MALTQDQAKQAGVIAAQIDVLSAAIASIQNALAAGMTLTSQVATAYLNGQQFPLSCDFPLNATDTATALNALLSVYQSNLTNLQNTLAGM